MLIGTREDLDRVLSSTAWVADVDYDGRWTLDDQPGWTLHLRITSEHGTPPLAYGTVYAKRARAREGQTGALLAAGVSEHRLEALLAALDGPGELRDLARLLVGSGEAT